MARLTADDIVDLRAYEREREEFRREVVELKRFRRVPIGPLITLLFENAQTIRFQIQEMARAEGRLTGDGVVTGLRIYNPLIPEPGHLSATLFIEGTSDEQLRAWLPKLVGVERAVELRLPGAGPGGSGGATVRCVTDPGLDPRLSREEDTAPVRYVHFALSPDLVRRFGRGRTSLAIVHPGYTHEAELGSLTVEQLASDLRHGG